ncbi:MAG: hypothetical protein AAFN70_03495, partial [Planctomycetota bacterium]
MNEHSFHDFLPWVSRFTTIAGWAIKNQNFSHGTELMRPGSSDPPRLYRSGFALVIGMVLCWSTISSSLVVADEGIPSSNIEVQRQRIDTEIAQWIEKLGDRRFAVRNRAQQELSEFGLQAFDQLRRAQASFNTEIAASARFLISGMQIPWTRDSDTDSVRDALSGYDDLAVEMRRSRIKKVAGIPRRVGLSALARIARFEQEPALSRVAAIEIMQQAPSGKPEKRRQHAHQLLRVLGTGRETAVDWLRIYADDLRGDAEGKSISFHTAAWERIIQTETRKIQLQNGQFADPDLMVELLRNLSVRAHADGQTDVSRRYAQLSLD